MTAADEKGGGYRSASGVCRLCGTRSDLNDGPIPPCCEGSDMIDTRDGLLASRDAEIASLREKIAMYESAYEIQFGRWPNYANAFPWGTSGDWRCVHHTEGATTPFDYETRDAAIAKAFDLSQKKGG